MIYEIRRERRIELISEGFRLDDLKRWNAMKVFENPKTMFGIRITDAVRDLYATSSITFGDGENARPIMEFEGKTYLMQYKVRGLYPDGRKWTANDKRFLEPIPMDEVTLNPDLGQNPGWN